MKVDIKKTGTNIYHLRTINNLSVNTISKKLNISEQAFYHWEQGKTFPSITNFVHLSRLFNVSIEEIIIIDEE